ncbi:pyrroline-5-carboxylate reductase [Corynebacterium kroppenstedtii]|uniref:pyrroline-5-carboxylate reductase n=1 Tax=Corynebacterium sp. PCR 32 TaxID=3351342 RepID=UPI0030B4B3B1
MTKIAVIGGGKIGEALIGGLLSGSLSPTDIVVANRRPERGDELKKRYGVTTVEDDAAAVDNADIAFLCVKPYDTLDVLEHMSDVIDHNDTDTILVSMAAGITLHSLESIASAGTAIVRVMPNTPMLLGKGVNVIARGRFVSDEQLETVSTLLGLLGYTAEIKESQMDAATAVSGSGPAYFFLVLEAMTDAGVNLGLPRELARELASQTALGAAMMATQEGADPVQLRANVSSPGGTTSAATRALDENGVRTAFYRAMEACAARSAELGKVSSKSESSSDN